MAQYMEATWGSHGVRDYLWDIYIYIYMDNAKEKLL